MKISLLLFVQAATVCAATATLEPEAPASNLSSLPLNIHFDNDSDPECTVITITGPNQANLLVQLTGALKSLQLIVVSGQVDTLNGRVTDVFRVTDEKGKKVQTPICDHA